MAIREVTDDGKKANIMPIFKKGEKEDLGNCTSVSLISILGKIMEQILLEAISKHSKNKKVTKRSQYGFMKSKISMTNLIAFYN